MIKYDEAVRLAQGMYAHPRGYGATHVRDLCTALIGMADALKEARTDAARYRFLAQNTYVEAYHLDGVGGVDTVIRVQGSGKFLDAAIDKELKE